MWRSCEVSMRTVESSALTCRQARQRPGVTAVYTADDLGDYLKPGPVLVPPPPIPGLVFHGCTQVPLAKDKVRHVGEPIAMIVADSRYVAEDALRDVVVDIEPLDAVVDLERALLPSAPLIHEHLTSNARRTRRAAERRLRVGSKRTRDVIVKRRFLYDRGVSAAIENRAVAVEWNAKAEELTIWDTTQAPIPDSQRPGADARAARVAGERHRAIRRRRFRSQRS